MNTNAIKKLLDELRALAERADDSKAQDVLFRAGLALAVGYDLIGVLANEIPAERFIELVTEHQRGSLAIVRDAAQDS